MKRPESTTHVCCSAGPHRAAVTHWRGGGRPPQWDYKIKGGVDWFRSSDTQQEVAAARRQSTEDGALVVWDHADGANGSRIGALQSHE